MATLAGNPSVLKAQADGLERSASKIHDAVADLRKFAVQSRSKAVFAAAEKVKEAEQLVNDASQRYASTASALQEYQVTLAEAHRRADEAADKGRRLNREIGAAEQRVRDLRREADQLRDSNAPVVAVMRVDNELAEARACLRSMESDRQETESHLESARRMVREAGDVAASQIEAGLTSLNDTVWSTIDYAVAAIDKAFDFVEQWVTTVLRTALDLIEAALAAVFKFVLGALKAIVLSVVLFAIGVAAAAALAVIIIALAGSAMIILTFVVLAAGVLAVAMNVALMFSMLGLIWMIGRPLAALGLFVRFSLLKDLFNPGVSRHPYRASSATERVAFGQKKDDFRQLMGKHKSGEEYGVDRLMASMVSVDALAETDWLGNAKKSVVEIIKVEGAPPHWIVTIPSTQDTFAGALNDWAHNLALRLLPVDWPTAYEREVLAVMREAGIGSNDPVMVQGFSQGGIMAARMAANPNSGFNVTAVVTAGSPVQDIKIPNISPTGMPVHVLSVQHQSDPVPKLDNPFVSYEKDRNRRSFYVSDPMDSITGEVHRFIGAHSAERYRESMSRILESNPSINDDFNEFLQRPTGLTLVEIEE